MLTRIRRSGVTLLELLVALAVGGLALGLVTSISIHEQRVVADLGDETTQFGRLRDASAILPLALRGVATGAGDVREARDTAIDLRATIATAVVCDTIGASLVLSPPSEGAPTFGAYSSAIEPGDTAWILAPTDSIDSWSPFHIAASASVAGAPCAPAGPRLDIVDQSTPRIAIEVGVSPLGIRLVGMPVRVTRRMRISLYRSSDGRWYLGEHDWNAADQRFNTIQPVSGPFLSPDAGGMVLQYENSAGVTLATPVADTRTIALIRIQLRVQTDNAIRELRAAGPSQSRTDSSMTTIFMHNHR